LGSEDDEVGRAFIRLELIRNLRARGETAAAAAHLDTLRSNKSLPDPVREAMAKLED
jgi:hypothetical protein